MSGIGTCRHTVHAGQQHGAWDRDLTPVLEVDSGESVELDTLDASGGQLTPRSDAAALARLDFDRIDPLTGPVFVRGARPGDVLEVEVLELGPASWGWTAIIPGFGLLPDRFPEPWLHHWELTPGASSAPFADGVEVPLAAFPGIIGLAPPMPGPHGAVPPHRWGGNLDIKHLTAGTRLYLPVGVEGALLSAGDTHAAQGDGEVCGTAIEARMRLALRLRVRRDLRLHAPAFETFGDAPGDRATPGAFVTTGVAADLMEAARDAVSAMIDYLMSRARLDACQAYALCGVAVDLRVHEVVDDPNWVVGAWLRKGILRR